MAPNGEMSLRYVHVMKAIAAHMPQTAIPVPMFISGPPAFCDAIAKMIQPSCSSHLAKVLIIEPKRVQAGKIFCLKAKQLGDFNESRIIVVDQIIHVDISCCNPHKARRGIFRKPLLNIFLAVLSSLHAAPRIARTTAAG
jgi:hypothetical protein